MTNFFKNLFGKQEDLKSIHASGAIVVDVRTPEEFKAGHIEGALNIPLDRLKTSIAELKKHGKPIITCCLSGARSGMALNLLSQAGLEVFNGGAWQSLERTIR